MRPTDYINISKDIQTTQSSPSERTVQGHIRHAGRGSYGPSSETRARLGIPLRRPIRNARQDPGLLPKTAASDVHFNLRDALPPRLGNVARSPGIPPLRSIQSHPTRTLPRGLPGIPTFKPPTSQVRQDTAASVRELEIPLHNLQHRRRRRRRRSAFQNRRPHAPIGSTPGLRQHPPPATIRQPLAHDFKPASSEMDVQMASRRTNG